MKKLLFLIPILSLAACDGSIARAVGEVGNSSFPGGIEIGTSDIDPGEFNGVSLAGPDNIVFTTGSNFSIRAEGNSAVLEQLRYKIDDGQIKIGRDSDEKFWNRSSKAATIYISAPALSNAKIAGSGNMKVDQMVEDSASISIAGSGNINVAKMETAAFNAKIAGTGDMTIAGSATNAKISVAGSGDVSGKALKAETAKISIAGSGDVTLSSDGAVDAKVVGSGDIRVHGSAKCKSRTVGSGDINCG